MGHFFFIILHVLALFFGFGFLLVSIPVHIFYSKSKGARKNVSEENTIENNIKQKLMRKAQEKEAKATAEKKERQRILAANLKIETDHFKKSKNLIQNTIKGLRFNKGVTITVEDTYVEIYRKDPDDYGSFSFKKDPQSVIKLRKTILYFYDLETKGLCKKREEWGTAMYFSLASRKKFNAMSESSRFNNEELLLADFAREIEDYVRT